MVVTATPASAHRELVGDVRPVVVGNKTGFVVYFRSSRDGAFYRSEYTKTGRLVAARSPSPTYPAPRATIEGGGLQGIAVQLRDRWMVFESYERIHKGQPGIVEIHNDTKVRHALTWSEPVEFVHDALASDTDIVLLVVRAADAGGYTLSICRVSPTAKGTPRCHVVGRSAFIYRFPVASKLVHDRGRYLVAWVEKNKRLNLTSFRPGSRPQTVRLARISTANTKVSADATDGHLLVAYHEPQPDRRGARIAVLAKKLPP